MQAVGQNIAFGAVLFFLATMLLRQVPVLGFFVRLFTRLLFLVSPLMIVVLIVAIVWFHGGSILSSDEEPAAIHAAPVRVEPTNVPLPPERPRD